MIEFTREELEALWGILEQVSATGKDHLRLMLAMIDKVEAELKPLESDEPQLEHYESAKQLRDAG